MKKIILLFIIMVLFLSCQIQENNQGMSEAEFFKLHKPVKTRPLTENDKAAIHFETYQEAHEFLTSLKNEESKIGLRKVNHTRPPGVNLYADFDWSYTFDNDRFGNLNKIYQRVYNVNSYIAGIRPFQYYTQQRYNVYFAANRQSFHVRIEGLVDVTIGTKQINVGIIASYHIDGMAYVNQDGRQY